MAFPEPDPTALEQIRQDSARGFLGTRAQALITADDGSLVYDLSAYDFLAGPAPAAADPVLWEHSARVARHGLFLVTEGVYQVRGFDLANLTLIEGEEGVIAVDALTSTETAEAALELYFAHRGRRPITGIILTHPHVDHFGGVEALLSHAAPEAPVLAPEGFHHHALRENLLAGPAMRRRSVFMYGTELEPGPAGHIGCGLGQRVATGTTTLTAPTDAITATGETRTIDGLEFVFQLTPGTEAPAEMNFLLPHLGALCLAENAVHTLHNIITLRGAQVRDAKRWSDYLDETLRLFGPRTSVAFATHHWPTWGRERVADFLTVQRDVYGFLHDQTVRLMNDGFTADEIAERLELPDALASSPVVRGFYGSVSHNVKGICQFYLGWFDGNPSHLWPLPKSESAGRWISLLGGVDSAVSRMTVTLTDASTEDLRFAAEVLDACVFADPGHSRARELLAEVLQRLGHGCENAVWRNEYLTAAAELLAAPEDAGGRPQRGRSRNRIAADLGIADVLDAMSVRLDGHAAASTRMCIDLVELDAEDSARAVHRVEVSNGVLRHHREPLATGTTRDPSSASSSSAEADLRVEVPLGGASRLAAHGLAGFATSGDTQVWDRLRALLTTARRGFPIVEPR
ncbi:alkyl/aryl-sulfatase [Brevibacterium renqingii]|uniref:alkyl/aryl-sulfatase n=1 Tax=Brevibacterium renqingii TaxID=2776916 RepID=UPI001AE0AB26|nr:alkyl sulfatase dimerization domain-containing protein [Brevibacterium renqingii]